MNQAPAIGLLSPHSLADMRDGFPTLHKAEFLIPAHGLNPPVPTVGLAAKCPGVHEEDKEATFHAVETDLGWCILPCDAGCSPAEIWNFRELPPDLRTPVADDTPDALRDEGVADFFATAADKIPWLFEPYVPARGLVVVQGPAKGGKTWFAAWLAAQCVALGFRVAVVEEEGAREVLRDRLKPFVSDPSAVNGTMRVLYRKRIRLDNPAVLQRLVNLYRGFDLIVLDPFIRLHGKKEQASDEMAIVLEAVQTLMVETGAAIVLVHHTKKSGWDRTADGSMENGRGSGVTVAEADNVIEIKGVAPRQRVQGQVRFTVENPGSRVGPEFEKQTACINLAGGSEPLTWLTQEAVAGGDNDAMEEALELIINNRKLPTTEKMAISGSSIAKAIKFNKQATLAAVARCVNVGVLETSEGRWGPVYWKPEEAK